MHRRRLDKAPASYSDCGAKYRRHKAEAKVQSESPVGYGVKGALFGQKRRKLTRQRKLRYLSDLELGLSDPVRARSLPVSPGRAEEIESPHWSVSAVPQPLPRPASPLGGGSSGGSGDRGEKVMPSSSCVREKTNIDATESDKPSSDSPKDSSQSLISERYYNNLRVDIPELSVAPNCNSGSAHSPRRASTTDIFHSFYEPTPEYNTTPPRRNAISLNSSPIGNRRHNPTGLRGTAFKPQDKVHKESSVAGLETKNIYPLPLPPILATKFQSAQIHQLSEKTSASSVKSQWQKGKLIGHGTFGYVYTATNRETGSLCAMKEVDIIPDDPRSSECIKQLHQEIEILSRLEHPNIVKYLGSEIIEDHFCIYLEYIHPGSINKYVHQYYKDITEPMIRNFTRHILNGLAYLHSTNTIHRDIKGANLLVDAAGVVKLADFGVAKHLTGQAYDLSMKGSPYWMAPEIMQATLSKDANTDRAFAIDIWSLGCTVIEMINGKPPWSELEGPQAMCKVLNNTPPIPDALSPEGKDFLQRCFRRNPKDRPSAKMLLDHPFLRKPLEYNVSAFIRAFSVIKLTDKANSHGDWTKQKTELKSNSPSRGISNQTMPCKGKLRHGYITKLNESVFSETPRQCFVEKSKCFAVACRHSPPILNNFLPSLSQRQLNASAYDRKLSPNALNYLDLDL